MLDRLLQLGVVALVVVMGVSAVAQPISQADAAKAICSPDVHAAMPASVLIC
jgi:hypothetical protein